MLHYCYVFNIVTVIIFLKMKTLIEINRSLWGKVKDYATVNDLNLYSAVERLLAQALISNGYSLRQGGDCKRFE